MYYPYYCIVSLNKEASLNFQNLSLFGNSRGIPIRNTNCGATGESLRILGELFLLASCAKRGQFN